MTLTTRLLAVGTTGLILSGLLGISAQAAPTAPTAPADAAVIAPASATTSTLESKRVDQLPTPKLGWYKCYDWAECATATVPVDYDDPTGKQTTVALLRVKARKPKARIGSLFINPGGPGGSATLMALVSPMFLSNSLLDSFDIIGMDPRGIGFSSNLTCFDSPRSQTRAMKGMETPFPYGKKQEAAYLASARTLATGCSTTASALAGSMSTAEVARDMELMRRAVGEEKLTYLGFSYGSALGQYYANMFPDRFRALAIDGVIDPTSWVGNERRQNVTQDDRLHSADGSSKALQNILNRCRKAGKKRCSFATFGDPSKNFATIARKLKKTPVVLGPALFGKGTVKLSYADFVSEALGSLYSPYAGESIDMLASSTWMLLSAPAKGKAAARSTLLRRFSGTRSAPVRGFPYDNSVDGFSGVMCTDGWHPQSADRWPALAAEADKRAPYFGRAWVWSSVQCARDSWTALDEDAYEGPFNHRTAVPVLVVGSLHDPATNYRQAVSAAKLLPHSRLLTSDNFGHTAYGTGTCATTSIDAYLLRGTLPAAGTVCNAATKPFVNADPMLLNAAVPVLSNGTDQATTMSKLAARGLPAADAPKMLPLTAGRL